MTHVIMTQSVMTPRDNGNKTFQRSPLTNLATRYDNHCPQKPNEGMMIAGKELFLILFSVMLLHSLKPAVALDDDEPHYHLVEIIPSDANMPVPEQEEPGRRLSTQGHVHFYVMGDTPYLVREIERFPYQLAALESRADFMVHVGDMKKRRMDCLESEYQVIASMLREAPCPTFIVPGDNDWFECADSQGAYSIWQESLGLLDEHWTRKSFEVRHQPERPENFAFTHNNVHVIGLHIVHASFNVEPMLYQIGEDALRWFRNELVHMAEAKAVVIFAHAYPFHPKYNDFLRALQDTVQLMYNKPFLYVQGEHHNFQVDNPIEFSSNFVRVVVDKGGIADPLEVVCDTNSEIPFKLKRRPLSGFSTQ